MVTPDRFLKCPLTSNKFSFIFGVVVSVICVASLSFAGYFSLSVVFSGSRLLSFSEIQ